MSAAETTLSAYVHVPYCRVRCGYCDFNTYTGAELRGAKQSDFALHLRGEIDLARAHLDESSDNRRLTSVFFGGGTPTLLPVEDLGAVVASLRSSFGFEPDAEVTVEANPDSVDELYLAALVELGFTRVSFGVQSAVPHVLKVLDRTHDPKRIPEVVEAAKRVGLATSIDLIYGTPGESLDDWNQSLDLVAQLDVDHVSAYALIVEEGTALERKIRRGEIAQPSDDMQALMYETADAAFAAMGLTWYEVSNWSRNDSTRSVHNSAYWKNADWWGFGAGAHSHLNGRRWWNVKHPAAYARRVTAGLSPEQAGEVPTSEQAYVERVLLGVRTAEGVSIASLSSQAQKQIAGLIARELIDARSAIQGKVVLTLRGRLLADEVVRELTD